MEKNYEDYLRSIEEEKNKYSQYEKNFLKAESEKRRLEEQLHIIQLELDQAKLNGGDAQLVNELKIKIQKLLNEKQRLLDEVDIQKTEVNNLRTEVQYIKNAPKFDENLD